MERSTAIQMPSRRKAVLFLTLFTVTLLILFVNRGRVLKKQAVFVPSQYALVVDGATPSVTLPSLQYKLPPTSREHLLQSLSEELNSIPEDNSAKLSHTETKTPTKLLTPKVVASDETHLGSDSVIAYDKSLSSSPTALQWNQSEDTSTLQSAYNANPCPSETGGVSQAQAMAWETFGATLEQYKQFHRKQLDLMKSDSNASVRILTWVCLFPGKCSGVGDQFYRIQQALLFAIISKRVLCFYWNEHDQQTMKYLLPNEIDWRCDDTEMSSHKIKSSINFKLEGRPSIDKFVKILDGPDKRVVLTKEPAVPFLKGYYKMSLHPSIKGRLTKAGVRKIISNKKTKLPLSFISGKLLRYLFTFSPAVISTVDSIQESLGIGNHPYLGVHIRTAFLGTNHEEEGHFSRIKIFRNEDAWLSILKCSSKLANDAIGTDAQVYLATDSYLVKDLAEDKFSPPVRTVNLTLQHVAQMRKAATAEGVESAVDGFMATWVDFLLLARARVLVRSISGFSTAAGQFCSVSHQYCAPTCRRC